MTLPEKIAVGNIFLGIELGSTRIKAELIDGETYEPLASGVSEWENELEGGIWTYRLEAIEKGLQCCYARLKSNVKEKYGVTLTWIKCIGISAMMHGYLAFDENNRLLVPFRTWRNTTAAQAAEELTELFGFNIPQRWSIAHLYQAILNKVEHVSRISKITTLAGYVHFMLTGENVLGVGDASGMFPIDSETMNYNEKMLGKFDVLLKKNGLSYTTKEILPSVLSAGSNAGSLSQAGAAWLDTDGDLCAGAILCPPEGDAGTGMVATNSVSPGTGNVSAGTSVFAMVVLNEELSAVYPEIDIVTTPDGMPVAMVHCNNCTSDLNAWASLFQSFSREIGVDLSKGKILDKMFALAAEGDPDCGRLCAYNYYSGEPITGLVEGRPMFIRYPDSEFTVENFMRAQVYAAVASLKIGMDILTKRENVKIDRILGHGGFFKAAEGQNVMAAALHTDVSVMETASEGGAYGMAILAAYTANNNKDLSEFLDENVFVGLPIKTVTPNKVDMDGFDRFSKRYIEALPIEKAAVQFMKEV